MGVRRKLSLDKAVLSELESDELAQLAGGAEAGTHVTCYCPRPTGSTCFVVCDSFFCMTYNDCLTVPLDACLKNA